MSTPDHKASTTGSKPFTLSEIFSLPDKEEIQACWELCRLHNNIGFWVVWLPTAWSIAMFYHANPSISGLACLNIACLFVPLCFGIKSLIMTIDDILDRDIDLLVERTKQRPLPRGSISPQRAWLFFALQVITGLSLSKLLKPLTVHVSMPAWPIFVLYPTCKRWMDVAPIPLGFMFAVGIFMGWSQLSPNGDLPWGTLLPVYLSCVFWTIAYETVYQHQDKVDDRKIGIRSPALFCGDKTIPICTFSATCFFALLMYGGMLNGHGMPFYIAVLLAATSLLSGLLRTNIDAPEDCKRLFLGTPGVGQTILAGLVVDGVLQRWLSGSPL